MRNVRNVLGLLAAIGLAVTSPAQDDNQRRPLPPPGEVAIPGEQPEAETPGARIDALVPKLASEDPPTRQQARQDFENLCHQATRPGAAAERVALCKLIVERLGEDTPLPARLWMLRQLANIGGAEVVPALSRLLVDADARVREHARRALEHNPAPQAGAALRGALAAVSDPDWRVALLNALAARRESANVGIFAPLVEDARPEVAAAALAGLAEMDNEPAAAALRKVWQAGKGARRAVAAEGLLRIAHRWLTGGTRVAQAERIFADLYRSDISDSLRMGALRGLCAADGEKTMPVLLHLVRGDDGRWAGLAAELLVALPGGRDTNTAIVNAYEDAAANPHARALLLRVLGQRGGPEARHALRQALSSEQGEVRIAALEALRTQPDVAAVHDVLVRAAEGTGAERKAARETLAVMAVPHERGPAVETVAGALLREAREGKTVPLRCEAIRALAARRCQEALSPLMELSEDAGVPVRVAAFQALGKLAGSAELPALLAGLRKSRDEQVRGAAEDAVVAVCGRSDDPRLRVQPVIREMKGTTGPARAAFVRVLGRLRGPQALQVIRATLHEQDEAAVDAAVRALAKWPDVEVCEDLLEIARSSPNETHRVVALRGYVRLVQRPNKRPATETFEMLREAWKLARRDDEKRQVLGALGGAPCVEALELIEPVLRVETLRDEAAIAMIRVARGLMPTDTQRARAAIARARRASNAPRVQQEADAAEKLLREFAGYCGHWLWSGPYFKKGANAAVVFKTAFAPEQPDAKGVTWRPLAVNNAKSPWIFDLARAVGGSNRAVYVRAEVWSDRDRDARLELGSDDCIKVWLNGELVHEHLVYRPVDRAQDIVTVKLHQGWNPLMLKIVQGGGAWGFCAGVRDSAGKPIEGIKFRVPPELAE